jgi:hypothetical protein
VAKHLQLARPMVRRGTGLNADQTGRQLLKEREDIATLQLPTDNHDAVDLKDRLRDIETDCREIV